MLCQVGRAACIEVDFCQLEWVLSRMRATLYLYRMPFKNWSELEKKKKRQRTKTCWDFCVWKQKRKIVAWWKRLEYIFDLWYLFNKSRYEIGLLQCIVCRYFFTFQIHTLRILVSWCFCYSVSVGWVLSILTI